MSEVNSNKTKRDLMWEQKKKMREEKLKSNQIYQDFPNKEEPTFQNNQTNVKENYQSYENLPPYHDNKNEPAAQNLNFNPFSNGIDCENSYVKPLKDLARQPASVPSLERMNFNGEQNFGGNPHNDNFQNNDRKSNSGFGNQQNNIVAQQYPTPTQNENNSNNVDPQILNKMMKKEYGDFLKNQMKEKENKKTMAQNNNIEQFQSGNINATPQGLDKMVKKEYGEFLKNQMKEKENKKSTGQNKVEQLQALMENQTYNPFGKPGGGGPNKKNGNPNPKNPNNYSHENIKSGNKKQENFDFEQNQFQQNEYNAILQNNLQNLQKEKTKMMNYQNFLAQQQNNNNNNMMQNQQSQDNYNQNFMGPGQNNMNQKMQPYKFQDNYNNNNNNNNNNFHQNNNNQNSYERQNNYNPANNYQQQYENENYQHNEQVNMTANPQNYQINEQDNNRRNFNSLNQDNNNNNGIPSMKVRTGRNRLMYENIGDNELIKKEAKAQEMQKALLEQIEMKKKQKEMEKERKRMEEAAEEMRLQKEREQLEYELKMEEEKKKAKFERVRQENFGLKEEKSNTRKVANNLEDNSKDISKDLAENVVKKPLLLRTDVSKEFLEQEGKKSRRNGRPRNFQNLQNQDSNPMLPMNNNNDIFIANGIQSNENYYNNNNNNMNNNEERNEYLDLQTRREMEIQNIKNEARNQQKSMQQRLLEIQNEASTAIKQKNQAEQELLNLRQMLKDKLSEEETYKRNLLLALSKNDPGSKKRPSKNIFEPQNNYNMKEMPTQNKMTFLESNTENKIMGKPLKIFERGGVTVGKEGFQDGNYGDKTLISDTKLIPMDILDQYAKNEEKPLTMSKIGHLAIRPNSSNLYHSGNRYEKILNPQENDTPSENGMTPIIRQRPFSQKNQRFEGNHMENSVNSEITKEIDNIIRSHQMELKGNNNKGSAFNQAAHGVLNSPKYPNYTLGEGMGIKLDSEFPTLKDQSLNNSLKSFGLKKEKKETNNNNNNNDNDNFDEIERLLNGNKGRQNQNNNNNRYEDSYKEQTLHSTLNIDDLNKRNDERLKEIDVMEKYLEGEGNQRNKQRNNLKVIDEEDELAKLDKLMKNL